MLRPSWRLPACACLLAAVEAAVLQGLSFDSALPLAPQVSAPAPFAVFHDLRWVWTFAWSPWSATWMLAALLAFRTLIFAAFIRLAWPAGRPAPSWPTLFRRSALFTGLAIVVMSPWATLTFVGAATGLSALILAGIIGSTLAAVLLPPGIISGEWWRRLLPLRSVGWILLGWVWINVAALAITYSPPWVTVLVAAAAGLGGGWIWQHIVHTVVEAGRPRWTVPGTPVIALAASAGLVVVTGYAYAAIGVGKPTPGAATAESTAGPPVVYVAGFDSRYAGNGVRFLPGRFDEVAFSYRGLDADGHPRPYGPTDTHLALAAAARLLAVQVQALHQRTGRAVALVGQSEGSVVIRTYLATLPHPSVDVAVELSPLLRPGRVYYPPAGHDGYGFLAGLETRGIMALFRAESSKVHVTPDTPFLRSLVDDAPLYRNSTLCPPAHVRARLLVPLEGAITVYRGPVARTPFTSFPGIHASLLGDQPTQRIVAGLLNGRVPHHRGWATAFTLIRGAGGAWQSPALPLEARPAWHAGRGADPAFGNSSCSLPPATG